MECPLRTFNTLATGLVLLLACGEDAAPTDTGVDANTAMDAAADEGTHDEGVEDMAADTADIPMGSCEENNGGCDPLVLCSVRPNGFIACGRCPSGYRGTGSEGCEDVDECTVDNGGCDPLVSCNNLVGSRECAACPSGYADVNGNGTRCVDVDECNIDNGGCGLATCVNTPGSFVCEGCPMGFAPGEGGCVDVDECALDNGGCDELTNCTNTVGSRTCGPCPSGYAGSGETSCMNIDECAVDNGGCDEVCIDVDGDFTCACNEDRVLAEDGTSCFEPIVIAPTTLPNGQVGEPYDASFLVSGGDGGYSWRIRTGSLPDGLMAEDLTSSTPGLVGTPSVAGEFTFVIQVDDTAGNSASQEYSVTIARPPLRIETASLIGGTIGDMYGANVDASGGSESGYEWRISLGALPPGLDVELNGTPRSAISGVPTASGTFTFTLNVRDADGAEATRELSIDISM